MASIESQLVQEGNQMDDTITGTVINQKNESIDNVSGYDNSVANYSSISELGNEVSGISTNGVVDNFNNDGASILYDVIHTLDDLYVYGRTVIENNYFNFTNNDDFNMLYPNVFVSNYSTTTNIQLLKDLGITHIISVIPTFNPPESAANEFTYLHIPAYDDETQDMTKYFQQTNAFISNVLGSGNGKILIHCMVGRSRSITILMAFLIHIIQGHFNHNKTMETIENINGDDPSIGLIYSSFSANKINIDGVRIINSGSDSNSNSSLNESERIQTVEFQRPEFSQSNSQKHKQRNFVQYKMETMIEELVELSDKYKSLKNELDNFIGGSEISSGSGNKYNEQFKKQLARNLYGLILKYVRKYRVIAEPNPHFSAVLQSYIFAV